MCRALGGQECQVLPQNPQWEGSAWLSPGSSAWLEAVDEPGARPRPCHTCAGSVSPLAVRQGAEEGCAEEGQPSGALLPAGTAAVSMGLSGLGCPGRGPEQHNRQHMSNSSCSHMLRVKPHAAVCGCMGAAVLPRAWRRPRTPLLGTNKGQGWIWGIQLGVYRAFWAGLRCKAAVVS